MILMLALLRYFCQVNLVLHLHAVKRQGGPDGTARVRIPTDWNAGTCVGQRAASMSCDLDPWGLIPTAIAKGRIIQRRRSEARRIVSPHGLQ